MAWWLIIFFITDFCPNMLNMSVINTCRCQCYMIITDALQPNCTVYYDVHHHTIALIDWAGPQTAVEMLGLLPWQALQSWLHTVSDCAYIPPLDHNNADNNNNNNNARHTATAMAWELLGNSDGMARAMAWQLRWWWCKNHNDNGGDDKGVAMVRVWAGVW